MTNNRRRPSPSTLFRRRSSQEGKLQRWKTIAVNWLNGNPTREDDLLETDSLRNQLQPNSTQNARERVGARSKLKYHLNPRNWKRKPKAPAELVSVDRNYSETTRVTGKQLEETTSLMEFVEEQKTTDNEKAIEARPPVRIIQLPPEPIFAGPAVNKKDDIHSTLVANEIHTAKYTAVNFLPKNVLEQMRRVANIYFVFIVFLQCFPAISNYNPFLAATPIIIIMAITAIKDAVEDWRRHQQDADVNFSIGLALHRPEGVIDVPRDTRYRRSVERMRAWLDATVLMCRRLYCQLRGKPVVLRGRNKKLNSIDKNAIDWRETFWRDMRVGDIIIIRNNEMIPADVMILATSEPDGVCFVETKNLDGETNLKIRRSPMETEWIKSPEDAYNLKATIEVDLPNSNLYAFNGRIILAKDVASPIKDFYETDEDEEGTELDPRKATNYSGVSDTADKPSLSRTQSVFVEPTVIPVGNEGVLLRGCIVRNTEYVIGVIIYTGPHTKLMLNSGGTPSKRSRIERQINPQIILNFLFLFIICMSCAIVQSQLGSSAGSAPYYVSAFRQGILTSSAFLGFLTFWSSMILFQTLVPISMYVTVEIVKTIQAYFINNDPEIYHLETNRRAVPRAWNLADDLGQIEYLFSDKTGTLTQNVMEFRQCSVGGRVYGKVSPGGPQRPTLSRSPSTLMRESVPRDRWTEMESEMIQLLQETLPYEYVPPIKFSFVDPELYIDSKEDAVRREELFYFFLTIIVCHTVLIDCEMLECEDDPKAAMNFRPHNLLFKAQSPDEAALVAAARDLGFVFLGRDKDLIFVSVLGEFETIEVLNVLEFSSDRKRMSTIVRRRTGEIILMCKGADNVIFERLSYASSQSGVAGQTLSHLEAFAEAGLRTLCLAHRRLGEEEYNSWVQKYNEAVSSMHNRDLFIDAICDEIERELELLGATAIEDRLQEGVPECIETLRMAGIKVWVLTGDKMETAINIGFSCRLLHKNMVLIVIKGSDKEETLQQLKVAYERIWSRYFSFGEASCDQIASAETSFALIIEGSTLKHALDPACRKLFINLSSRCVSVICCRVSPLQKAKVVTLIKRGKNVMTMAIGDGANDVSMIQAADIGVGIAGQEGMQAVMSSDYAIAQFRFLTRLLLVHGRWSYVRVAEVTLCSLYKNLAFVVLLYWYQFFCGFTAQYVYDYMYLLFFNMLFSIVPLLCLGSFDRDLKDQRLVQVPPIYRLGIEQRSYSMKLFFKYMVDALWQSAACFFIVMLTYKDNAVNYSGHPENQTLLGNVMAISIITCTNLYVVINTYSWVIIIFFGLSLSLLMMAAMFCIYSFIPGQGMYGSWQVLIDPTFWCTIILSITVSLGPRCLFKYVQTIWKPSDLDIVREISKWHVNEASLVHSVKAPNAVGSSQFDARSIVSEQVLTEPPKAIIRSSPRRLLGIELTKEIPEARLYADLEMATPILELVVPQKPSRGRFFRRSLALFNLRSGRFEKMTGYAFSQEEGMGELVTQKRRCPKPETDPSVAFGAALSNLKGSVPRGPPPMPPHIPAAIARPTQRSKGANHSHRSSVHKSPM